MSTAGLMQAPGSLNRWCWGEVVPVQHQDNTGAFDWCNHCGTRGKFEKNVHEGKLRSWNIGSPGHCWYRTKEGNLLSPAPWDPSPDQQWQHGQGGPKAVVANRFHQTPVFGAASAAAVGWSDSPGLSPRCVGVSLILNKLGQRSLRHTTRRGPLGKRREFSS